MNLDPERSYFSIILNTISGGQSVTHQWHEIHEEEYFAIKEKLEGLFGEANRVSMISTSDVDLVQNTMQDKVTMVVMDK